MLFLVFFTQGASSQTATAQDTLKELMRRIDILTEEIEKKKLGEVAERKYEKQVRNGACLPRLFIAGRKQALL